MALSVEGRALLDDNAPGMLIALIAECYHRAALVGADMMSVTRAIEEVRNAAGQDGDLERAADAATRVIAAAQDASVLAQLNDFRASVEASLFESTTASLREQLQDDADEGWRAWQGVWAHALWHWPDHVFQRLATSEFPVPGYASSELDELRIASRAVQDGRWSETYEPIARLAAAPWLAAADRVALVETLAMIQLLVLSQPTAAKELLEQAEESGIERHRVCAGWAEWWLDQAVSEADLDRAGSFARRAVDLEPYFGRAWVVLGSIAEKKDGTADSRRGPDERPEFYYRQAIANGEFDGWGGLLRIELDRADGNQDDPTVQALLKEAERIWPHRECDVLITMATLLSDRGSNDEADSFFLRAITLDPTRVSAYVGRGYERYDAGDIQTAREMFATATKLAPGSFGGAVGTAWLSEQLGEWEEAVRWYEAALARRPQSDVILISRIGPCLSKLGRSAEAEQRLMDALRRHPDNGPLASALADLAEATYRERNDPERAKQIYDAIRAVRGEAYEGTYRNSRGHVAYWQTDYAAAQTEYQLATVAEPNNAVFHSNVAQAAEARLEAGDPSILPDAIIALRRAHELDPDSQDYSARLAFLELRAEILTAYGAAALERTPFQTPVRIYLGDDFLPYILIPDTNDLQPSFQEKIDAMRARVQHDTGVWLPGIRFATFEQPAWENLRCLLSGVSMRTDRHSFAERFSPAPLQQVNVHAPDARTAANPTGGPDGTSVPSESWDEVQQAGLPLWTVTDYLLGWVEGIVRRHLVEFVGHSEMAARIADISDHDLADWADRHLTAVTAAVRMRVREEGKACDVEQICRAIMDGSDEAGSRMRS
jgi:tetratricopeptide (TPR) repeat protein